MSGISGSRLLRGRGNDCSCPLGLAGQSAAQSNWQKEWEKTLAAAKKEGQVNIYIYRYERLLQDFKKDYPGINVVVRHRKRYGVDNAHHGRAAGR